MARFVIFPVRQSRFLSNKWKFLCLVTFLILFSHSISYARGIYGYLQFSYNNRIDETGGSKTEIWDFEQKYRLRYSSFIYHPNLLEYSLGGTFIKINGATTPGDDFEAKASDYGIRLNFLKTTSIPFQIYAEKETGRSFTFLPLGGGAGSVRLTESTRKTYGLEGSLYLDRLLRRKRNGYYNRNGYATGYSNGNGRKHGLYYFARKYLPRKLNYKLKQTDWQISSTGRDRDEKTRSFALNFRKGFKKTQLHFDYNYSNRLDRISETTERSHSVAINTKTNLTKKLSLTELLSYNTNSLHYNEFKNDTRLYYHYSRRLTLNARSLYKHREEKGETTDTLSNSLNAAYRRKLIKNLTTTAGASISHSMNDSVNNFSESVRGALIYSRKLPGNVRFSSNISSNFSANQRSELENTTSFGGSAGSSISKNFIRARTRTALGGSYFYSRSSLDTGSDGYDIIFDITNRYIRRFLFKSRLNYHNENFMEDETPDKAEFTTDTTFEYSLPIGYRGKIGAGGGISTISGTTEKRNYYVNASLWYIIIRNLGFKSTVRYALDGITDRANLYSTTSLGYRFRLVSLSATYEYYTVMENGPSDDKKQHILLRLTRRF